MIGKTLGNYEITGLLGRGGMGEVYLARDARLDRTVALKVLPAEFAADGERLRRFEIEARAASALKHPNITHIYDVGEADGIHFIVMEHVEGKSLGALISAGGMEIDEIVDVVAHIAEALDEAHSSGITHRDIKPGNVLLTSRRQPKILDFGLAKVSRSGAPDDATQQMTETRTSAGTVLGTVQYMSPEQALGKAVDSRTDIFSLGVMLYELLTGTLPFKGETPTETITNIVHEPPQPIEDLNAEVPPGLRAVLSRCLAKRPDDRYPSAGELAADLRALRAGSVPSALSAETAAAKTAAATARPHSRAALWAVAGVAAVIVLGYALFSILSAPDTGAIDSIAVLPFENATGDPGVDYLTDGIAESLIHSLSGLPDLKVTSRSSAFALRDERQDVGEIGRKLGVDAVVLGRMVQRGDAISISAELVEVDDLRQLWGDRYDRTLDDLVTVERNIASTIALKVRSRLSTEQAQQLTRRQTDDSEAYRLYLKGRQYQIGTVREMNQAVTYYQRAIEREPLYAMAHAGLAQAYVLQAYLLERDRDEAVRLASAAAERAMELDETLAEAHAAAGMIKYYFEWDWKGAEEYLRRAMELGPGTLEAYEEYSNILMTMGRFEEAVETARIGSEFDPLSVLPVHQLGIAYMADGNYEAAAAQFLDAQGLRPGWVWGHIKRGKALAHTGQCDEALREVARGEELLAGTGVFSWSWIGWIYGTCGEEQRARDAIAYLENLDAENHIDATALAVPYAAVGDETKVIELLERAYGERSASMVWVSFFPEFFGVPGVRENPRFQQILTDMNLQ